MGRADFLREGDWNRICDRCGFKYKASDTVKDWQGLIVCHACHEGRHPQDFVRGRRDRQRVPWSRPEPEVIFAPVDRFVRPGAAQIRYKGWPLSVLIDAAIPIGSASISYQGYAPSVFTDETVNIGSASITYQGYAPTISIDQLIAIGSASITYTGFALTVDIDTVYVDDTGATYVDDAGDAYTDGI